MVATDTPIQFVPVELARDCEQFIQKISGLAHETMSYQDLALACDAIRAEHPRVEIELRDLIDAIILD